MPKYGKQKKFPVKLLEVEEEAKQQRFHYFGPSASSSSTSLVTTESLTSSTIPSVEI